MYIEVDDTQMISRANSAGHKERKAQNLTAIPKSTTTLMMRVVKREPMRTADARDSRKN